MARRGPKPIIAIAELVTWLLFVALLVPAGFVGWVIGHYSGGHTRTVTVSTPKAPGGTRGATTTTSSAGTTTAAATTAAATTAAAETTTAAAQTTTAAASGSASAAQGKTVFASQGCGSCHTLKAASASGTVGPDLDTKPQADAGKAKTPLAAFVRESIVDPNKYISPGYPKGVMPENYDKTLSKSQIDSLVALITGGT